VWLNEVRTDAGPRYIRSVTVNMRRCFDKKTGEWKDASSLRPTDLPSLILGLRPLLPTASLLLFPVNQRRTSSWKIPQPWTTTNLPFRPLLVALR
jgi:hypothetical protein